MSGWERLTALTAELHRLEAERLRVAAQRDAEVRRSGLGPRALARVLDVSPATAARLLERARRSR